MQKPPQTTTRQGDTMNRSPLATRSIAPSRLRHILRPTPLAVALLAALPVMAQQAPATDTGKLETVTVTATKRVQPLQTTPIAISVISGGALEESNLNNLEAISSQVPTVNFRTNASNKDSALFIRGVGTISTSPGVEPTVSTVLDGVVTARPGQATLDLVEIDRIEILRGPQGTLFGKNASAGVINIVTRAPGKETTGYVDLAYFQGNEKRVRLGLSGELVKDTLRGSISAMAGKYDGNVTNVFDGSTVNGYDRKGVRGRLDITPSRDLKISLIADRVEADDTPPTGVAYSTTVTTYPTGAITQNPLFAAAVAPVVASPTNRQINSEMKTRVNDVNQGLSAQVDYTFGGHQLTSITALRQWENHQFQDQDRLGTLYRNFNRLADEGTLDFEQVSQELRIASTGKGFVDYVAGLFYIEGKNDEVYRRDTMRCAASTEAALPSGLVPCTAATTTTETGIATYGVRSKSASIFGEGTFNFSQRLRAIAGLRYTADDLSYYHGRESTAAAPGIGASRARVDGSTSESALSGRFGPQFDITPDSMAYATYSRGYKGPAYNVFFNMGPTQDNVLAPEKSKSVEVGLKNTLMDGRMRLNVAAFQTNYTGYQANVPDLVGGVIVTRLVNAGEVSTKGVEVDLQTRVTSQFTLNTSLAHVKARVKNFTCPVGAAASCDINGKPLPFSPDWKASVRAKYTQPLSGGLTLEFGVDANWQSKTNFDLQQQPDSVQKAYTIVNATVALQSAAGWRVALLAKNLTDESYATFIQSSGNHINRYVPRDDQRYFGVNFRYDF
jgi:iron complex outermembrane recepter protein